MRWGNTGALGAQLFLVPIFAFVLLIQGAAVAQTAPRSERGMLDWAHEDMVGALNILIPERMAELDVPGLSLAIVKEGEIVWSSGFGTAARDGSPVSADTIFEAASLGKPVTAYGVMMMVNDKKLFLDGPLSQNLEAPWVSDRLGHEVITLRHVLTHSSGLSNFIRCCSRGIWSDPGAEFSYSGVGYMYAQHVMEEMAAKPFDLLMRERVLMPLGMSSTGFGLSPALADKVAVGHVPAYYLLLVFFLPFLLVFGVLSIVTALVVWLVLERVFLRRTDFILPAIGAVALAPAAIYMVAGGAALALVLMAVVVYLVLVGLAAGLLVALFGVLGLLGPGDGELARGPGSQRWMAIVLAAVLAVGASVPLVTRNIAAPASAPDYVNAASSLRSTANDLARFMIGFMDAKGLGKAARDRMVAEAVPVGEGISWGLGIAKRVTPQGETLWQWGSNPGYESLMVMDMERRAGVVILTNSYYGAPLVQEIAGHVLGEAPGWSLY